MNERRRIKEQWQNCKYVFTLVFFLARKLHRGHGEVLCTARKERREGLSRGPCWPAGSGAAPCLELVRASTAHGRAATRRGDCLALERRGLGLGRNGTGLRARNPTSGTMG